MSLIYRYQHEPISLRLLLSLGVYHMNSIFIIGTDTEVGKTYVTGLLIRNLRDAGINAAGMKPVASGLIEKNGSMVNEDIETIVEAAGDSFDRSLINQYLYAPFVAPHLVAAQQGEEISLARIYECYRHLSAMADCVVVEGAGGLMTPLNDTQTFLDLARILAVPVVLVVAVRLGCINHALLTEHALQSAGVPLLGWVANYPQESDRDMDVENSLKSRLQAPLIALVEWQGTLENSKLLDVGQ